MSTTILTSRTRRPRQPQRAVSSLHWPSLLFFALFHGAALLAPWCFSWSALGVALLLHWLSGGIGICLGYHRLLSHRSFRVPQWLEYGIATVGALALQGGPIFWVSNHRRHHAFAEDLQADPHSSRRGFWWSHMGWLLRPQASLFDIEYHGQYAPELVRDRYYRWLGRNFLVLQVVLAALLYSLGGWPFVVYGIFVRAVLLWHATWCVNSATHYWGYRNFNIADDARNLWWVSLITYGEGWHNNHHRFPRAAQTGWRWWELDVTWATIRLLQQFGLAQKVRTIPVDKADLRTQANLNGNSRKI